MADEPDNETQEASTDAAEQAPEAQVDTPQPEETPAEETPAEETEAAQDVEAVEDAPAPVAQEAPSEPAEVLHPKERRRRTRAKHTGEAQPSRTPEERHAERTADRARKATRRRARRLQERAKAAERRASAPAPEPLAPVHAVVEGAKRVRQGVVVSDKAQKTITVRIDVARRHRRYEKIVRSSSTLHAHDENNDAHEGDVVRVIESRPLSRTKRWSLVDVLERAR
jgi:small subunit ribosomal protein S17